MSGVGRNAHPIVLAYATIVGCVLCMRGTHIAWSLPYGIRIDPQGPPAGALVVRGVYTYVE
jgi:hypothetical protein